MQLPLYSCKHVQIVPTYSWKLCHIKSSFTLNTQNALWDITPNEKQLVTFKEWKIIVSTLKLSQVNVVVVLKLFVIYNSNYKGHACISGINLHILNMQYLNTILHNNNTFLWFFTVRILLYCKRKFIGYGIKQISNCLQSKMVFYWKITFKCHLIWTSMLNSKNEAHFRPVLCLRERGVSIL